jgi:hypothetical protein
VSDGLSTEPSAPADAVAFLECPLFLPVLLGRPDERPSDDREGNDGHGADHYLEKGAHGGKVSLVT